MKQKVYFICFVVSLLAIFALWQIFWHWALVGDCDDPIFSKEALWWALGIPGIFIILTVIEDWNDLDDD